MTPFWLLVIFVVLAICAFVAFVLLTYKENTPRHDDWKRFLSSFAGTALALSVGFISLMLQQENQSQQNQAEQVARTRIKLNEENGQIRARLLYSVAQKKFELGFFLADDRLQSKTIRPICDTSVDQKKRDERLLQLHAPFDPAELQLINEVLEKLFSSEAYERHPLNRLMKETGFSARIDQDMLSDFLTSELELNFVGPKVLSKVFEFSSITQAETFCNSFEKLRRDYENLIRDVIKLQVSTCVAYAIIGLPIEQGLEHSKTVTKLIQRFYPSDSDDEKSLSIEKFRSDLASNVASEKSELESCLAFADVDLRRLP